MRDMDKWLGDGGMPLIGYLGAAITAYGEGFAEADWTPAPPACNPGGTVQAGVYGVVLDAVMNFALLAALGPGERVVTLEMKVSTMRPAPAGEALNVRGDVVRLGRRVGFAEGTVTGPAGVVARASGTFGVNRPGPG